MPSARLLLALVVAATACSMTPAVPVAAPTDAGNVAPDGQLGTDALPGVAGGSWTACLQLAQAFCARQQACYPVRLRGDYGTPAVCAEREAIRCSALLSAPFATLDAQRLAACAAQVDGAACDAVPPGALPACAYGPGQRPSGAACGHHAQCQGRWCSPPSGGKDCGTCGTRLGVGEKCQWSQCEPPAICAAVKEDPTPRCRLPPESGQACTTGGDCTWGTTCLKGTCSAPPAAGAKCGGEAGSCDADQGYDCSAAQQVCTAAPFVDAGQTCNVSGVSVDTRILCDDAGCANQNDFGQGQCTAYAAEETPCDSWTGPPCRPPATCRAGACRLPLPGACTQD